MPTQLREISLPLHSFQKLSNKEKKLMSRHASYGKSSKSAQKRNVLKRFERIDVLRRLGKWKDGENTRVTNLPKTPVTP